MKKYFLFLTLGISTLVIAQSPPATMAQFDQAAQQCQNLDCARQTINAIDSQIVTLIGERLSFVKRAGELKGPSFAVNDLTSEAAIMNNIAQQAQAVGYSPFIARSVFTSILFQSNILEQQYHRGP